MKVESILEAKGRSVETTSPDVDVVFAIQKLTASSIGALVVSSDGTHLEGVISERDIVWGLNRHGARLLEKRVSEVMSRHVPVCSADDTLKQVMETMTRTRNRHLPVVDDGRISGIVSIGDIVKHRLEELELEARVLRDAYRATH
jgi:CBS domain-containing protein